MPRTYTMTAGSIITKARAMINDDLPSTGARTTDAEFFGCINDALNVLLNIRPGLFSNTLTYTCVAGYRQAIESPRCVEFMEVVGVPECDRMTLTQFLPNWNNNTAGAGATVHWMREPADPLRFDVYPPALANATLTVRVVESPAPITALADTIKISENYEPMLVEYVAGRTQIRDDEHVNSNRAVQLMDRFVAQAKGA